ncbi:Peptidyl-prolyl isomerase CWC27 [Diplonema papillatum]|nr:Peptidyl-prolyl isomerase CWC27 [Diplonema papillatum]
MAVPSEAFDLPTSGKVMLHTSLGDVCIELWAKECPVTCRNFLQHCVNQYPDGSPFHRVVKGFCVQTGDPTGTGTGGASTHHLGKAFKTETHARLRFKHRAMVAMAGEDGDNWSQFFITLREAPELSGKHSLFGPSFLVTNPTSMGVIHSRKLNFP